MPKARALNSLFGAESGRTLFVLVLAFLSVTAFDQIIGTLIWEFRNLFAMPAYDDMFDHARMYRAMTGAKEFLLYLISAHNEHRIFTTRILAYLDDKLFGGREYTQVVATNILQICSAWISWRIFTRNDLDSSPLYKAALFVAILLLFVNPNLLYTLIYPFQVQHAIMAVLCVASASLVAKTSGLAEISTSDYRRLIALLLVLALIATLTLGNAPVIFIAAAAMAVVLRWRSWVIAALSLLAVGHTVFILSTTVSTGVQSYNLLKIFKFALIYLGGPFIRLEAWPAGYVTWPGSAYLAALCGAVVLVVGLGFALARLFKPNLGGPTAAFGSMLLAIVIVTALAAGHARAQFGLLEGASKKYSSFSALGWLGVLAVAAGLLREHVKTRRWLMESMLLVTLLVLVPFSISGSNHEFRIWQKWREQNWEAALAVFLQINDGDQLHALDENPNEIREYLSVAQAHNTGIFSRFQFRWGDNAATVLASRKETSCRGEVESATPISPPQLVDVFSAKGTPLTITGWTWMDDDHAPAATIIAIDSAQRIVGAALTTRNSARAETWLGQKFDQDLGWYGFARVTDSAPLKFYALSGTRRTYCPLGTVGNAR
jgi:hypothetical protein